MSYILGEHRFARTIGDRTEVGRCRICGNARALYRLHEPQKFIYYLYRSDTYPTALVDTGGKTLLICATCVSSKIQARIPRPDARQEDSHA